MATLTQTVTLPPKANGYIYASARKAQPAPSGRSMVGNFQWSDVLISKAVGRGMTKKFFQYRTLRQYARIYLFGLYVNKYAKSTAVRAAALNLLFPGAGLTATASLPSLALFAITTCAIPFSLFLWFASGGVFFPLLLWAITAALSALLAGDTLVEGAAYFWAIACPLVVGYIALRARSSRLAAEKRRVQRNKYLVEAVKESQSIATVATPPRSRELDLRTLRFVQWFIELGLADFNDWSYHDVIDQFQTSALRYQLYEAVSCLGLYQAHYAPNFHGYLSEAQRNAIHKSCTKKVMNFWKWESVLGKFNTHDWNPITKDNITVTGYLLQAIGIYENNTGDKCFREKDSLELVVADNACYKTNFQGLAKAVYDNMNESAYCLYSCEPNWIHTPCNLVSMGGIVAADRALKTDYKEKLGERFLENLEEEFTRADGSIQPVRSELTGFTIPGLCGILSNCLNSILCAAYLPHIAYRNWAMSRRETVSYGKDGKISLKNLTGADRIDLGNYTPSPGAAYVAFAAAAAEFGDTAVRSACLSRTDNEFYPVHTTASGSLKNSGLSTLFQGQALRARLAQHQDWSTMLTCSNPPRGPVLARAEFPKVLVAKAYSDGEGLELVLYNGLQPALCELGIERLEPGREYVLRTGEKVRADREGKVVLKVWLEGRTEVMMRLG